VDPIGSELLGKYEVWLLNHNGNKLQLLETYEVLEYIVAATGNGSHLWGSFRLEGVAEVLPVSDFQLDRIVSIRRQAPGLEELSVAFEGFHRRDEYWFDENDKEHYRSAGPELKAILARRIVRPNEGQAFLIYDGPFTDIMRYMVRTQLGNLTEDLERKIDSLVVEAYTEEGVSLPYVARDDYLHRELETLADLGAMFNVKRVDDQFNFQVFYPRQGRDRHLGNTNDNDPVVFSLSNGNMGAPRVVIDRLGEVNVVYVAGDGPGALRPFAERTNLWEAEDDSPLNRMEGFLDASAQATQGALNASGDAYLTEHRRKVTFSCIAIPTIKCIYGQHWNVGDLVTGIYRDVEYTLSVDAVQITLNVARGETIIPTFRWIPEELL